VTTNSGHAECSDEAAGFEFAGPRFHLVEPKATGVWAVDVSGNWRVTFQFEGTDAINVNYCDYH
jgi:toxin HigB-1